MTAVEMMPEAREAIRRRWTEVISAMLHLRAEGPVPKAYLKPMASVRFEDARPTTAVINDAGDEGPALAVDTFLIIPLRPGEGFTGEPPDNEVNLPEVDGWRITVVMI